MFSLFHPVMLHRDQLQKSQSPFTLNKLQPQPKRLLFTYSCLNVGKEGSAVNSGVWFIDFTGYNFSPQEAVTPEALRWVVLPVSASVMCKRKPQHAQLCTR